MASRSRSMQDFLDSLREAFAAANCEPAVSKTVATLFAALEQPAPEGGPPSSRLPVCQHVPAALRIARSSSPQLARLAATFETLEPRLAWAVRSSGGPYASANWLEGHANATIIGPDRGLESRNDVAIGVSLLAPNVRYPDHRHAPEEVYLLLTPGRFQHGESSWFEPGASGTLHNEPNIEHAMASQDTPLLAIWCLLMP